MIARREGWIVNHASLAGAIPPPYSAVYAASKAGLIAWNQAIQPELAHTGVHASALITTYVSEAGLHARRGMPGHWLAGEVSPERVADAVLQALNGKRQIYITRGPMRPLHALSILLPGGRNWLFKQVGLYEYLRKRAKKEA
jgi:short-subunit dehydrogenase